jgi:hypothetical protein
MSTAELKIDLINQITGITDQVKLKELLQLLNFKMMKLFYVTDEDEKKAVLETGNEIKNRKVSSDAEVQKEISEWLNK